MLRDERTNNTFKSALSSSKADILNIWCKNCSMWQLLWTTTETINKLFPVVNFLKCIVTEVVLFSIIAFKTLDILQGSVATQVRCGGIFSDSISTKFSSDSESEIILKIGEYLAKLRRTKIVPIVEPPCMYNSRIYSHAYLLFILAFDICCVHCIYYRCIFSLYVGSIWQFCFKNNANDLYNQKIFVFHSPPLFNLFYSLASVDITDYAICMSTIDINNMNKLIKI